MSLAAHATPLIAALERLGPHDHFCSIYESPQEHYAVAIPFIRIGLDHGEKCIYIADDGTVGDVRHAMESEGIDVDRAIASRGLILATKEQAYMKHGTFDPDWMFTFWREATQLAMSEGFSALRATGETEWVLRGGRGLERWMEYESRLTHTLSANNCSALCQYNRSLFPPELILDVIRTHPMVVYRGTVCRNLYYVPPDEFLGTNQTAREVERLLTNIREREHVENALREQLAERRRAEEELARISRVTTLGEITASIAHEINQPLGAIANNASACLRWLGANNVDEARQSAELIRADGHRAGEIINRIRSFAKKAPPQKEPLDINQTIDEVIELVRSEAQRNRVSIQTQLATKLPLIFGDRIQLQQVILNLMMNAIEAMAEISGNQRELLILSENDQSSRVRIALRDSGAGLNPESLNDIFTPFYTTKPEGVGMGLAICRSIVDGHGGRLWATANDDRGATFQFTLPTGEEAA
jgi:signal transduction histidine kinase